jgi:hypothetical protein
VGIFKAKRFTQRPASICEAAAVSPFLTCARAAGRAGYHVPVETANRSLGFPFFFVNFHINNHTFQRYQLEKSAELARKINRFWCGQWHRL